MGGARREVRAWKTPEAGEGEAAHKEAEKVLEFLEGCVRGSAIIP